MSEQDPVVERLRYGVAFAALGVTRTGLACFCWPENTSLRPSVQRNDDCQTPTQRAQAIRPTASAANVGPDKDSDKQPAHLPRSAPASPASASGVFRSCRKGPIGKMCHSRSDSCHVQLCYPPRVRLRARARLLNDSVAFRCRPEPLSAQLGRALLRLEIHVHEPEAGTEAVSPFEIVHRAPVEGALYRHTFGKGRVMRVRGAVRD